MTLRFSRSGIGMGRGRRNDKDTCPIFKAEREARKAFRQVDAEKATARWASTRVAKRQCANLSRSG